MPSFRYACLEVCSITLYLRILIEKYNDASFPTFLVCCFGSFFFPHASCTYKFLTSAVSALKDVDGFHPTNLGALTKLGEDYRKSFRTPSPPTPPQQRTTTSSLSEESPPTSSLAARVDGEYPPICLNSLGINAPCTALG
jgi:hypothetical protein